MKISSISGLMYSSKDLDVTAKFYETLGFRAGKRDDTQLTVYVNWFWLTFTLDADADAAPEPGSGPALYMKVDDIDDYYGGVLAQGFAPTSEPRKDRSGRREFVLPDPDGHQLVFFTK